MVHTSWIFHLWLWSRLSPNYSIYIYKKQAFWVLICEYRPRQVKSSRGVLRALQTPIFRALDDGITNDLTPWCVYIYIHRYCYTYSYTHIYVRWEHEVDLMTEFMSWATQVLVAPVAWLILQARCIDTRSGSVRHPAAPTREISTQGQFPNDFLFRPRCHIFLWEQSQNPRIFLKLSFLKELILMSNCGVLRWRTDLQGSVEKIQEIPAPQIIDGIFQHGKLTCNNKHC